jgi:hypothetical protein
MLYPCSGQQIMETLLIPQGIGKKQHQLHREKGCGSLADIIEGFSQPVVNRFRCLNVRDLLPRKRERS